MAQPLILTVDDDPQMLKLLERVLHGWGYEVRSADSAESLWQTLPECDPSVILLDIGLGSDDGVGLLEPLRERVADVPVIMVTGDVNVATTVQCIKAGAFDYVTKPLDHHRLRIEIEKAIGHHRLHRRVRDLESAADRDTYQGMIGSSAAMREVYRLIECVAPTDATTLILGETGVGKEVAAHAMHAASRRAKGPFVPVNCAALPADLTESALFGHSRGAFTGAVQEHVGFCEQADGGTLFLDEIGEMEFALQAKLLRFLQDHTIQRVGGTSLKTVDVRVIAATNRDPREEIEARRLREDLYYRLNVVCVRLPALRDREGDSLLLARHFAQRIAKQYGRDVPEFAPDLMDVFQRYPWPGNVRELQHLIERLLVMHAGGPLKAEALPSRFHDVAPAPELAAPIRASTRFATLAEMEEQLLRQSLTQTGWDVPTVAKQLGISEATVYRKIKKYGLTRPSRAEVAQ